MRKLIKIVPFLMVIFLVSMSFACASDTDEQILANDTDSPDNGNTLSVDNDGAKYGQTNTNELKDNENVKNITSKTFSELTKEIRSAEAGSTLVLLKDCSCESGFSADGIGIQKQITIDGNNFSNEEEFYIEIDKLLTKDLSWKTGHNLNAFNDLLRGGFGFHAPGEELMITWVNAEKSRKELGEELFNMITDIILDSDNSGHECKLKIEN